MNDWAEFRHFRYLLAIVEHEGFRAAAEYLHTAQPNLSAQAKQFQDLSDIHLFERTKDGGIRLTETGVAFGPIAQGLLDARDEAMAALVAIERGEIPSLRFGSTSLIDQSLFHACCQIHKEILPNCPIFPTHGDMPQLEEELLAGEIDAAVVTLPVADPSLRVEVIRQDRLVVCLRRDHKLAAKQIFEPSDLHENLKILYNPDRHFHAHQRHRSCLREIGIEIDRYSRANHPSELRELVKQGYGFALVREGSKIDDELTTRPIAGVDWKVSIAVIYNEKSHPKTIPVLVRHLKRQLTTPGSKTTVQTVLSPTTITTRPRKRPLRPKGKESKQMSLLS
ncbi:LysR family transcriptional regulator [Granulicella sp. WH15]|uniref:LysR family transcriptional regulator n=1 Tax=Granulicella sp. WH15 TaxID=2602070 RepID=UPI001366C425|nr:LysR family transcriptional regulator [Granulicella sp. WH15]QHN02731.1 LysR family transcriptional regulator [Granulicella sp. WH15]